MSAWAPAGNTKFRPRKRPQAAPACAKFCRSDTDCGVEARSLVPVTPGGGTGNLERGLLDEAVAARPFFDSLNASGFGQGSLLTTAYADLSARAGP